MGLKALAESPYLKNLESLKIWKNEIGDEAFVFVGRSRNFLKIKTMMLNDNLITHTGVADLATVETLPQLETLNLFRNELGDGGAVAFANSKNFPNLQALYMGQNNITDAGATALLESKFFPKLKTLDLVMNPLSENLYIKAFKIKKERGVQVIFR